jgi:hypothetical protein
VSESPTLVIGRYSLHAPIASGGMGVVHFATMQDRAGPRVVAAKRLHPHLRHDQSFAMMLLDEARLAVSVRHPNVVEVIDVVSTPTDLVLVMEYVPGVSVYELLTHGMGGEGRRMAVPLPVAITIAVEGLHGLQAAHDAVNDEGQSLNLVHRDISPQNLLVDSRGVAKLTDFGVAKAVGRLRSTRDGSIRGKIAYMSPEQVADSGVDQRADIYSFAVVLWEMIAGRPMLEAESDVALFGKAMRGPTERLASVVPDIPPALDNAIWRALSRDPRRRHPSARAFADALVDAFGAVDHGWVAKWMRERAGTLLARRLATVDELLAEPDAITATTLVDATNGPVMLDPVTTAHAPPPPNRGLHLALLSGAALAALVVGLVLARGGKDEAPLEATPPAPLLATPPEPPAPTTTPAIAPAATPSLKVVTTAPKPRPTGKKPEKDPKADCNPPYTEDETGKHFKSWCLR